MRTLRNKARGDQRGAAAVEMALVLPLLIMLVFGIYEFGLGFHQKVLLSGAVREGARARALGADDADTETAVQDALPSLVPDAIGTGPVCPGGATAGDRATVSATFVRQYNIPFLPWSPFDITLNVEAVMRCET